MTISTKPAELLDILGVGVANYSKRDALSYITACIEQKHHQPVAFLNANNANIAWTEQKASSAFGHFIVLPDGIGIDLAARLLHGSKFKANLNGTDFVPALLRASAHPLRVGLLGAAAGIADQAIDGFLRIDDRHHYRAISHGFFDVAQEQHLLAELSRWKPDVLLVALGAPRQEIWISKNLTSQHCTCPIAVGALLDFVAGNMSRAPKWVRYIRCEWIYRLLIEPRRLWRRYLLGNPLFLARILFQRRAKAKHGATA